jgi:hypothetical protein
MDSKKETKIAPIINIGSRDNENECGECPYPDMHPEYDFKSICTLFRKVLPEDIEPNHLYRLHECMISQIQEGNDDAANSQRNS